MCQASEGEARVMAWLDECKAEREAYETGKQYALDGKPRDTKSYCSFFKLDSDYPHWRRCAEKFYAGWDEGAQQVLDFGE